MAAKAGCRRGQSLLEFMLLMPMMLGIVFLTYQVNSAIQTSIVNQQYARSQALWLTYKSPIYPYRANQRMGVFSKRFNAFHIGASANSAEKQDYVAVAPVQTIAAKAGQGITTSQMEPNERGDVRIRTAVAMCTPPITLADGQPAMALSRFTATTSGGGTTIVVSKTRPGLSETSSFKFCNGEFDP